jgi:hypothetical protein
VSWRDDATMAASRGSKVQSAGSGNGRWLRRNPIARVRASWEHGQSLRALEPHMPTTKAVAANNPMSSPDQATVQHAQLYLRSAS